MCAAAAAERCACLQRRRGEGGRRVAQSWKLFVRRDAAARKRTVFGYGLRTGRTSLRPLFFESSRFDRRSSHEDSHRRRRRTVGEAHPGRCRHGYNNFIPPRGLEEYTPENIAAAVELNASKAEVLRLEKLIETLSSGGAQVDDIETEKMELQELQHAETVALDDLRPVKLSLLKSVLACTVCSLGTETQPNVVFEAHFEEARLFPKDQDPHKFMTGVMKEAMSVCWKAHGVTADRQAALENDLAKFDEDADFKLLRPASKWQTARCLKEFKTLPSSKPAPSKVDRSAKGPGAAAESKVPYSPFVTLADVKGPIEQKLGGEKLSVAVMITCDKLEAGCAIRLKADDCVVGGRIAYFLKQDGKSKQKEAVRNDCVTLVLDVIYQPGLLVSEKPHTEIRITAFEDDDHSRWSVAVLLRDC